MTLIIMNNEDVLEIPQLLRLALKSIYEKKRFTFNEERQLHKSIIHWADTFKLKKELSPIGELNAVDDEGQMGLEIIAGLIQQDANGEFEARKELFRRHNIDYKKFHRLPESYRPEDFKRAQRHLEDHKRTNPEDYA